MGVDLAIITTLISPMITIACLAIGFVIKYMIPGKTIDRFIPLIVLALGIIFNVWYVGAFTFEVCVAGAISGLASSGLYEVFAQMLKLNKDSNEGQHALQEEQHCPSFFISKRGDKMPNCANIAATIHANMCEDPGFGYSWGERYGTSADKVT